MKKDKPGRTFVDWDLPLSEAAMILDPANAEQKRLQGLVYPAAENYLSPVPTIFLHRLADLRPILGKPIVVARDGAIPLLLFFRRHGRPPAKFTGKLAVHESLLPWVPPAWQEVVVSYRHVSSLSPAPVTSVFIYGTNSAALISPESCELALAAAGSTIAKAEKRYLCLPSFFFSKNEPLHMHAEIARLVFMRTGPDIEVVEWGRFLMNRNLAGFQVVCLMNNTLVADPWLTKTMLRLGATIACQPLKSNERLFSFSRSHGLAVQMRPVFPAKAASLREEDEETLLSSFEAGAIDWPAVFSVSASQLGMGKSQSITGPRPLSKDMSPLSGF